MAPAARRVEYSAPKLSSGNNENCLETSSTVDLKIHNFVPLLRTQHLNDGSEVFDDDNPLAVVVHGKKLKEPTMPEISAVLAATQSPQVQQQQQQHLAQAVNREVRLFPTSYLYSPTNCPLDYFVRSA